MRRQREVEMAKAKRKRRASFRTMEADSAVSALDEFERLEQVEAQRRAALAAAASQDSLPADDDGAPETEGDVEDDEDSRGA